MGRLDQLSGMLNAFVSGGRKRTHSYGPSTTSPPVQAAWRIYNDRSIMAAIYTRMAIDISSVEFRHVRTDKTGRYIADMDSRLNEALMFEPNLDQNPRAWRQDLITTLFDSGAAALVPVDYTLDDAGYLQDIYTIRVGTILEYYSDKVRVSVYNEATLRREEVILNKRHVAIVENPMYAVMNQPSAQLQRLIRKLNLLDSMDEQLASGKLDLIIKLPYVVKSQARRDQATARREELEMQLKSSTYGVAYIDGTEDITQLNRPVENNLLKQVEYLTREVHNHLGLTEEIMNGTADESAMLNYYNRVIEPIADSAVEAMRRSFIGHTKRKQQTIRHYRNPFKFVPLAQIAEIGDKMTRNKIMTTNEIRDVIGLPPSDDPSADTLENPNMPSETQSTVEPEESDNQDPTNPKGNQNGST